MITFDEARQAIARVAEKQAGQAAIEEVSLQESLGRVLAEDIRADRDYPPFNRSAMDGYALHLEKPVQPGGGFRLAGEVFAGQNFNGELQADQCLKIMTGAPVPAGLNCVVKVEDASVEDGIVVFKQDLKPWQNIARQGEDSTSGQVLCEANNLVDTSMVTTLASCGYGRVKVKKQPRIAVITTGDEVVSIEKKAGPAEIRNSNREVLLASLALLGIEPTFLAHCPDNEQDIISNIKQALQHDLVLLCGGVSMGDADYVPGVLNKLGVEKVFHRIQIKPGKPLWFGKNDKTVVFGLPGNPLSTQVGFKIFIEDFLRQVAGVPVQPWLKVTMGVDRSKKSKFTEFAPCQLDFERMQVIPRGHKGSGDITSTLQTSGLLLHPAGKPLLAAGSPVQFLPWRAL